MCSRRSKQPKKRSGRAVRRPHPPRTPGAGFPPAAGLLFSSAALAAIVPKPTCTQHTAAAAAQDSIQETPTRSPWRERSAAIREAHPQEKEEEEEEEETDRPACRSSRDAAAMPFGRRSPGATRTIRMRGEGRRRR